MDYTLDEEDEEDEEDASDFEPAPGELSGLLMDAELDVADVVPQSQAET